MTDGDEGAGDFADWRSGDDSATEEKVPLTNKEGGLASDEEGGGGGEEKTSQAAAKRSRRRRGGTRVCNEQVKAIDVEELVAPDRRPDGTTVTTTKTLVDRIDSLPPGVGYGQRKTVIRIGDAEAAFILGRGGRTKLKIGRVSGCRVNLTNNLELELVGDPEARARAELYVRLVLQQRRGQVLIDFDETDRNDLTIIDVPSDSVAFVTGAQGYVLRSIEEEWNTLMFFVQHVREDPTSSNKKPHKQPPPTKPELPAAPDVVKSEQNIADTPSAPVVAADHPPVVAADHPPAVQPDNPPAVKPEDLPRTDNEEQRDSSGPPAAETAGTIVQDTATDSHHTKDAADGIAESGTTNGEHASAPAAAADVAAAIETPDDAKKKEDHTEQPPSPTDRPDESVTTADPVCKEKREDGEQGLLLSSSSVKIEDSAEAAPQSPSSSYVLETPMTASPPSQNATAATTAAGRRNSTGGGSPSSNSGGHIVSLTNTGRSLFRVDRQKCACETLLIFGSDRGRRGAELKVMSAAEQKSPGRFAALLSAPDYRSEAEGFDTDRVAIARDDFSYVLGKDGSTRRKLTRASHCILECVGHTAFLAGTKEERTRCREYLDWLIRQRTAPIHIPYENRNDALTIVAPASLAKALTNGRDSCVRGSLEGASAALCILDSEAPNPNEKRIVVLAHSARAREQARRAIYDELDKLPVPLDTEPAAPGTEYIYRRVSDLRRPPAIHPSAPSRKQQPQPPLGAARGATSGGGRYEPRNTIAAISAFGRAKAPPPYYHRSPSPPPDRYRPRYDDYPDPKRRRRY